MAMEMGADIVKLNMPKIDPDKDKDPRPLQRDGRHAGRGDPPVRRVRRPLAGRALRRLEIEDEELLEQTGFIMDAGGSGVIYGRNVWQREWSEAIEIVGRDQGKPARERHAPAVGRRDAFRGWTTPQR